MLLYSTPSGARSNGVVGRASAPQEAGLHGQGLGGEKHSGGWITETEAPQRRMKNREGLPSHPVKVS